MAGHAKYSAGTGALPFPKMAASHKFIQKALGATMWFWIFYRLREVSLILSRLELSVPIPTSASLLFVFWGAFSLLQVTIVPFTTLLEQHTNYRMVPFYWDGESLGSTDTVDMEQKPTTKKNITKLQCSLIYSCDMIIQTYIHAEMLY